MPFKTKQETYSIVQEHILEQLANANYLNRSQLKLPFHAHYDYKTAFDVCIQALVIEGKIELLIPIGKNMRRGQPAQYFCLKNTDSKVLPKTLRKWSELKEEYM